MHLALRAGARRAALEVAAAGAAAGRGRQQFVAAVTAGRIRACAPAPSAPAPLQECSSSAVGTADAAASHGGVAVRGRSDAGSGEQRCAGAGVVAAFRGACVLRGGGSLPAALSRQVRLLTGAATHSRWICMPVRVPVFACWCCPWCCSQHQRVRIRAGVGSCLECRAARRCAAGTLVLVVAASCCRCPDSRLVFLAYHRMLSSPATEEAPAAAPPAELDQGPRPEAILHKAPHHNIARARAVRKRFKTSVKKLNLVCKLVRRARVDAALMQLALNPKRVAVTVRKAIYDAKFNAANNHGMDPDRLLIDEIVIGRSTYLKRVEYKGRGRTGVRKKPFCYMAVYVREIQVPAASHGWFRVEFT